LKLFIRDHLFISFVYFLQLGIILLVIGLDHFQHIYTLLYAALLSTSLFAGYLIYRYVSHRSFYMRLSAPISSLEDFTIQQQSAPLPEALNRILKEQHYFYSQELYSSKYKSDEHIHFMNQWVHQMKTPISVIHLLAQDIEDPMSESIEDELDRLRKGLDLVLYSARLDTFERDFHVESFSLYKIIRIITSSQKRLFIRSRVYPDNQVNPSILVTSDEKWLSFVILQILTNAVRYTINPVEKIIFKAWENGDQTILEIIDHGVGIPKSDLSRVFDPYFTGENGRAFQESTGMGLYLVKQICEKLGHQVVIDSTVNKGTSVRIIFQ
jgi:OmpR family two-component system sensor histidine kinase YxdK